MEDLAGARSLLAAHRLGWLGQRGDEVAALADLAGFELIVTCEGGADVEALASVSEAAVVTLERDGAPRRAWTNASVDLLAQLDWQGTLAEPPTTERPLHLLAYCATPAWQAQADGSAGWLRLLAAHAAVKTRLDDKARFRAAVARLGLPAIPSALVRAEALAFPALARRFGVPFVTQRLLSSAGHGTFEIHGERALARARAQGVPEEEWLVSAYIGPASFNVNALALPDRVLVAPPSVQLVGVPELTERTTVYCGNDFAALAEHPPAVAVQIVAQTERIGRWLTLEEGFLGCFGVDYVLGGDKTLYPLELNPRMQGSTGLLGQWEQASGRVPLAALHGLHWLGAELAPSAAETAMAGETAAAAHMIVHWRGPALGTVSAALGPGIYTLDAAGRAARVRDGARIADCAPGEFVVTGVPPAGTVVEAGAALLRVQARARLARADGRVLTPWGAAICSALLAAADAPMQEAAPLPTRLADGGGML